MGIRRSGPSPRLHVGLELANARSRGPAREEFYAPGGTLARDPGHDAHRPRTDGGAASWSAWSACFGVRRRVAALRMNIPSRHHGAAARGTSGPGRSMRILLATALLSGCSGAPDGLRLEGASVATNAGGGLASGVGIAAGSRVVPVLAAGCALPCTASQTLRASSASQDAVGFQLYQGTGTTVAGSKALGTFQASWRGMPSPPSEVDVILLARQDGVRLRVVGQPGTVALDVRQVEP